MIQDKLTTEQRIRLEALNQTNAFFSMKPIHTPVQFWDKLLDFEKYIKDGGTPKVADLTAMKEWNS